jgi:hypothetical protein
MEQQKIFGLTYIQALGALAAVIGIVAAFLTWVSVSVSGTSFGIPYSYSHSYSGLDSVTNPGSYINGSGIFLILLSILALGVIFLDRIQKMAPGNNQLNGVMASVRTKANLILLVFGALIVLIAGLDLGQINSIKSQLAAATQFSSIISISASADAGIGLYLALIAGLGLLVSGFFGLMQSQKHPQMHQQQYGPSAPQNQTYQQPGQQYQPQQYQQQPYTPAGNSVPGSNPAPQQTQGTQFCGNCGAQTTGSDYCMKCGNKVK